MRTLRMSLVGTAILVLLGSVSLATVAQEESLPVPVYVTGRWQAEDASDVTYERWFEDSVEHRRVAGVSETWEWSDPRLPGEWTVTLDQQFHQVPDVGQVVSWSWTSTEADGPEGSWTVNARGMLHPPGDPASVITLEGQGGYDGLYAVLDCGTVRMPEDGSDPPACEGYLFEGEPPQLPAPMPAR